MIGSRFSLLTRMSAVIAVFGGVLVATGLYSTYTRSQVQVGGPYYRDIAQTKDLVADILPPPAYILEAYLLTFQIATSADPVERGQCIKRLKEAEDEFQDRKTYWSAHLAESRMRATLVVDAARHAEDFFAIVRERFLPAVAAGRMDEARQLATHELHDAYQQHRQNIDEVVALANQLNRDTEAAAEA